MRSMSSLKRSTPVHRDIKHEELGATAALKGGNTFVTPSAFSWERVVELNLCSLSTANPQFNDVDIVLCQVGQVKEPYRMSYRIEADVRQQ